MIIPSFWDSTHDATAYPEPDKFIPERWLPKEDGEQPLADKYPQNYMVWGSGPHKVSGIATGATPCVCFPEPCWLIRNGFLCVTVYWCAIRFDAFGCRHR
jgi:hypothetical protein